MPYHKDTKIFVAGHLGLVGSAICRELKKQAYTNILTRTHFTSGIIIDEKKDILVPSILLLNRFNFF